MTETHGRENEQNMKPVSGGSNDEGVNPNVARVRQKIQKGELKLQPWVEKRGGKLEQQKV